MSRNDQLNRCLLAASQSGPIVPGVRRSTRSRSRGTILIVVLLTIVILTLSGFAFLNLMSSHNQSSRLLTSRMQSKFIADSGVDYVRLFLSQNDQEIHERGGLWHNENNQFTGVPVAIDPQDPTRIGLFTIIAPTITDEGTPSGHRYGLTDESSKLNVNTLPYMDEYVQGGGRTLLMALPDMTDQIADAIIDWVDSDDDVREYGAESPDYAGEGYQAKNGPMDSIEELLLVRGVTPQLMFGKDDNRNGKIDINELGDRSAIEADMLLGWASYLTLYSKESNLNPDGLTRININSENLEQLYADLRSRFDENWSRYIVNYRLNGPYTPRNIDEINQSSAGFEIDYSKQPQFQFNQVLDLIGGYTTAYDPDDLNDQAVIASPVPAVGFEFLLPTIMRSITTYEGDSIPGRINIMQAPRVVMEGIPGMTSEILDSILESREPQLNDPEMTDLNR